MISKLNPLKNFFSKKKKADSKVVPATVSKDGQRRFGVIKTSLFNYITPKMIIIAIIIATIVGFSVDTLTVYFLTNIYLNGLIIGLLLMALVGAFYNNFLMYKSAVFLKRIETLGNQEHVSRKDIDHLHARMVKDAYYLDTQNMHEVIESLDKFDTLIFTDNHARLIKSKMGFRIRLRKGAVSFTAGILVMLGLLGTFLGLLKTIDAVGQAMASMSALGGDNVTGEQMTGFISSLSEPLQGMGLAFSSSLFGLSGSLLIGFFNHLCGDAQDSFIENVGRWIDDRIPRFDPAKKKGDSTNKPADKDDLQTWLAGYVYMSIKTNKRIAKLTHGVMQTLNAQKKNDEVLSQMATAQYQASESLKETNIILRQSFDYAKDMFKTSMDRHKSVVDSVGEVNHSIMSLTDYTRKSGSHNQQLFDNFQRDLVHKVTALSDNLAAMRDMQSSRASETMEQMQHLVNDLKQLQMLNNDIMRENNKLQADNAVNGKTLKDSIHQMHEELSRLSIEGMSLPQATSNVPRTTGAAQQGTDDHTAQGPQVSATHSATQGTSAQTEQQAPVAPQKDNGPIPDRFGVELEQEMHDLIREIDDQEDSFSQNIMDEDMDDSPVFTEIEDEETSTDKDQDDDSDNTDKK